MTEINKDEIRKAIDRLQIEHPAHFTFDVTLFDNGTDFTAMQRAIDMVAKKSQDDADINIICEFAKLYLEGVKPTIDRPYGEWIYKNGKYWCSSCGDKAIYHSHFQAPLPHLTNFCPACGAKMVKEGNNND